MFCLGIIFVTIFIFAIVLVVRGFGSSDEVDVNHPSDYFQRIQSGILGNVSASSIESFMQRFSNESHIAGSNSDHRQAQTIRDLFSSWGFETQIDEYSVLLSYPLERELKVLDATDLSIKYEATLKEQVVNDGTSSIADIDTFNAYSGSGYIDSAPVVYCNYGTEEDYNLIHPNIVNLTGSIVIVRYGHIFRGNKVYGAQKRGAIGVLIYVDPSDTGYLKGPVYTEGPWSSNSTVQRGSIWTGNGDPTTPGWPSIQGAPRLSIDSLRNPDLVKDPLPSIPVLPISYGDAGPILTQLNTIPIPSNIGWPGGFNLSFISSTSIKLRMRVNMNETLMPIWNVIGTIQGGVEPEKTVIMGAHRDAWVLGAGDPISGTSSLLETARVIGLQVQSGTWKPRRTIKVCSWDAEEFALIGSVEFTEDYYNNLREEAVIYFNLDIAVKDRVDFSAAGVPSLHEVLKNVTDTVSFKDGRTVTATWPQTHLGILGSGSDYTGFIQHVGVPSLHMEFRAEEDVYQAIYHSIYDSFYWYKHFGDPDFEYHATLSKVLGLMVLRFAELRVLPFNYVDYGTALTTFVDNLETAANSNGMTLSFKPMRDQIVFFQQAAQSIQAIIANGTEDLNEINDRLMKAERAWLATEYLSGDPWYLHVLYAPSKTNYYAGSAFPALFQAIQNKDTLLASDLIGRLAVVINGVAQYLNGW